MFCKKTFLILISLLLLCVLISVHADELALKLDVPQTSLAAGTTMKVVPSISDETITKAKFTWETSDKKVAAVSNGNVRGVGNGTATITCSTNIDGKKLEESFTLNVYVPVKGIKLKQKSITLEVGESVIVEANVFPGNANNQQLVWNSDHPEVATVDENGVIMAVFGGDCKITASSTDGSNVSASVSVFVPSMSCSTKEVNLVLGEKAIIKVNLYVKDQSALTISDGESSCNYWYNDIHDDILEFHIVPWSRGHCNLTIQDPNSPKSTIKIKLNTSAENSLEKGCTNLNDGKYREILKHEISGDYVWFDCSVKQVEYQNDKAALLVATKKKNDNYVYIEYDPSFNSDIPKFRESNNLMVFGKVKGFYTYKTTAGTKRTVPKIDPLAIGYKSDRFVYFTSRYYSYDLVYEELDRGSTGDEVVYVQNRLAELGYYDGSITGNYDSRTKSAFKQFEANNNLTRDGIASLKDLDVLFGSSVLTKAVSDSKQESTSETETKYDAFPLDALTKAAKDESQTKQSGSEQTAFVENAPYFYNISNNDVMKTNTSRVHAAVEAMLYVAGDEDEVCKDFTKAYNQNMTNMKIAIGKWRENYSIVAIAFKNGEFYCFEISHYSTITPLDVAYIAVTKIAKQSFYDKFDVVLKNMEAQKVEADNDSLSLKFVELSYKDVGRELLQILESGLYELQ